LYLFELADVLSSRKDVVYEGISKEGMPKSDFSKTGGLQKDLLLFQFSTNPP
jgi:hypothetical protein